MGREIRKNKQTSSELRKVYQNLINTYCTELNPCENLHIMFPCPLLQSSNHYHKTKFISEITIT